MSLTAEYRTEIVIPQPELIKLRANIKESPCTDILRLALQRIAQERNGTLTQGYYDCNGQFHRCLFGLKTADLPKGLGVNVALDGRVVFQFDQRATDGAMAGKIGSDIARAYAVIAVMRAQNKMGHQINILGEAPQHTGKTVRIKGVRI